MSEKRKPHFVFLLRNQGKKNLKVELFDSFLWRNKAKASNTHGELSRRRYRVRSNGKWFSYEDCKYTFLTRYEIRDLIWRSSRGMF